MKRSIGSMFPFRSIKKITKLTLQNNLYRVSGTYLVRSALYEDSPSRHQHMDCWGVHLQKKTKSLMMGHPSSRGNVKVAPLSPIGVHKFRNKALQCKISPIKSPRRIFRLRGNVLKGSGYRLFDLWHDSVRAGTKCLQATQYITLHYEPPNNRQYRPDTLHLFRYDLNYRPIWSLIALTVI